MTLNWNEELTSLILIYQNKRKYHNRTGFQLMKYINNFKDEFNQVINDNNPTHKL